MRLIIVYKLVKVPVMLSLAIWLTAAPGAAFRFAEAAVREITEAGAAWTHAGAWIQANLGPGSLSGSALLAWADGLSSAIESLLLLSGKVWAEWVVIVGLFCLLPLEILAYDWRPGTGKLIVLTINAAIVGYLIWERLLREDPRASGPPSWLHQH